MAEAVKVKEEEQRESGSGIRVPERVQQWAEYPRRFRQFLHEVRVELKNVTWPTLTDVRATTIVVIVTVLFFGVYLFGVDRFVSWVVEQVLQSFKR